MNGVPAGWDLISVGEIASFTSGSGIRVGSLSGESADTPIPVFGGNGVAGFTDQPLVHESTVVVGRVGQKCGEVYLSSGPAWITDNALYPRIKHREFDLGFFAVALAGAGLNDVKNRNDLPLVTQTILHSVRIAWPSDIQEQRAIAVALGDVDALLDGLDRLIAKKRDLKRAAMQELLSGQTRLAGFYDQWRLAKVKSLCEFVNGEPTLGGDAGYIEIGDIDVVLKNYDMSKKDKLSVRGAVKVPPGTLLISTVRPTRGAIAIVKEENFVSSAFCRLNPSNGLLFHLVCQDRFLNYLGENSIGGTYPTCRSETIINFECLMPSDPAEQTAIAAVLSDMDAELTALHAQRDKTSALKQAMMQELLTGKTRLV